MDQYRGKDFEFVITVCDNANERCPFFPTKAERFHRNFSDPAKATGSEDEILAQFRVVRDQIKEFSETFIKAHLS
jgi:arsenate reductase